MTTTIIENAEDTLICGICKGKRVITTDIGKIDICPKCLGSGTITKEIEEQKLGNNKENKKILLG